MAIRQEDYELLQERYHEAKAQLERERSELEMLKRAIETDLRLCLDRPISELGLLDENELRTNSDSPDYGSSDLENSEDPYTAMLHAFGIIFWKDRLHKELDDRVRRYERYLSQTC